MKIQEYLIDFDYDFPIKIIFEKIAGEERDWHKTLRIFYILEGNCEFTVDNQTLTYQPESIFIINPYTIYETKTASNVVFLIADIDLSLYGFSKSEIDRLYFVCNSVLEKDDSKFHTLIETLLSLIRANITIKDNIYYLNQALSYQLLFLLMNQYKVKGEIQTTKAKQKNIEKIKDIVDYIEDNYKKNLTLSEISKYFNYAPQYFSTLFTQNLNQTFQTYYDTLRINKSLEMLVNSNLTLDNIATEVGFADYRSYIRAFKNIFNLTPSAFKKEEGKNKKKKKEKNFYIGFDKKHYLDIIFEKKTKHKELVVSNTINDHQNINFSFLEKGRPLQKTYQELIYITNANLLLIDDIKDILVKVQKEIGFKYLRFHGLLSDDLHIYRKSRDNHHIYSYVYIDKIFDFLKSINLKPFLTLDYIPESLAANKNRRLLAAKYIVSEPKFYEEWQQLITALFEHFIDRYGILEVETWPVSIWNQPDSTKYAFGFDNNEDFYKFYSITYKTIKNISSKINVGSPALIPFASFAKKWDYDFLRYSKLNQVYPDFLALHYYSNDFDFFINNMNIEKLNKDPNNISKYIDSVSDISFYYGKKIYLVEWNVTSSQRNYINDTIYSSCYFIKNILENNERLHSFSKSSLTDFSPETQLPNTTFHGGSGMFTYNNIPKASYYAYTFLAKLGNEFIKRGENYFITKNEHKIIIILYNYEHFIDLFADGEYFSIKYHERYEPFKMDRILKTTIKITDLDYEFAKIKISRIARDSGSSYDILETLATIEPTNPNDIETIKALSIPKFKLFEEKITNNSLEINATLNPLEVKLIEIELNKKIRQS